MRFALDVATNKSSGNSLKLEVCGSPRPQKPEWLGRLELPGLVAGTVRVTVEMELPHARLGSEIKIGELHPHHAR